MRNLNLILTPVLMAGLMILGVKLFREDNQHWLIHREVNATTQTTVHETVAASAQEPTDQTVTVLRPVPDVISQEVKSWPKSQRHSARLHPEMITPGNFEYMGAFIPPHFEDNVNSFAYSSGVLAFRPDPVRPET